MTPTTTTLLLLCITLVVLSTTTTTVQANTLTIVVEYPENKQNQFTLRGDGLGLSWDRGIQFNRTAMNQFTVSLSFNSSSYGKKLELKVLVQDRIWQIGANTIITIPIRDAKATLYPFFFTGQGRYVVAGSLQSTQLHNTRQIVVYTPPSYDENPFGLVRNVLVMHDGQNVFNDSTAAFGRSWRAKPTLDGLVVQGAIEEVLVVAVYNTPQRMSEYTYSYDPEYKSGGKGDLYLDFLTETVLPFVRSKYRISNERKPAILGSSLGGLISCYAGWTRPNSWSKAGCMSSSFWWNDEDFNNQILVDFAPPPQSSFIYLDSGDSGPSADGALTTIAVRNHMQRTGFTKNLFYYLDRGGSHNEYSWGERFYVPITDLFPPSPITLD